MKKSFAGSNYQKSTHENSVGPRQKFTDPKKSLKICIRYHIIGLYSGDIYLTFKSIGIKKQPAIGIVTGCQMIVKAL